MLSYQIKQYTHFPRFKTVNYQYSARIIRNMRPIWIMVFYVFFCNMVIVSHFFLIIMLVLLISFFIYYFFICSIYICLCWIDWLPFLSLLALNVILSTYSGKTIGFLLLNHCNNFKINLIIFWILYEFLLNHLYQVYFF